MKSAIANILLYAAIAAYNLAWTIARYSVVPFLFKFEKQSEKWDLAERLNFPLPETTDTPHTVEWVHAASLGEAKLLTGFLAILHEKHPDHQYIVTGITRTGVDYLRKHKPDYVLEAGFMPFDTNVLIGELLTSCHIRRVWIMETELWPSMLYICRKRSIPVGIVNARMEQRSFAMYKRFRFVLQPLFENFDIVLAQNEQYAGRYFAMGVHTDKIHSVGNLKSRVTIRRPAFETWQQLRQSMGLADNDFVITAGCIHIKEGLVVAAACRLLESMGLPNRCILVPRYLDEVAPLERELNNAALVVKEFNAPAGWNQCIIAAIGVLDDAYSIADAAVIGGTFSDIGGHSMWDAARFGIPVFFGPDYSSQAQSCARIKKAGVGFETADAHELAEKIFSVMRVNPREFIAAQKKFIDEMNAESPDLKGFLP